MASDEGNAPTYVNIAHRAALLYSFASIVMFELVLRSPFSPIVELGAVVAPVVFFMFAVSSYLLNGRTQITDNQFRDPPKPNVLRASMWALIISEIGGITVLVVGFVITSLEPITAGVFLTAILVGILALLSVLYGYGVLSFMLRAVVNPSIVDNPDNV